MIIDGFNTDDKVLIIAEIGNNHEGSYALAKEMIVKAKQAGADAVKFQTIVPEKLVSVKNKKRIEQLTKYQLSYDQFLELSKFAKEQNMIFLSTPFDLKSAEFLNNIVPAFKIASGDNNFFPLIEYIANTGKPLIMSTGMMNNNEMQKTVEFINNIWNKNKTVQELALLHCIVSYPTPIEQVNLNAIKEIQKIGLLPGYSDHTLGIDAAIYSVVLGARIIEKHFTIDKNYSDFHDHKLAADPNEFKIMVKKIRELNKMLGNGKKIVQDNEKKILNNVRRCICASMDLKKGTKVEFTDLCWLRPAHGIEPGNENLVIGKNIKKNIKKGDPITLEDLE